MTVVISRNPATNEIVWEGPAANATEVDAAVRSARQALAMWAEKTPEERYAYLERFAEQLKTNHDHLAEAISKETGKPYWEAKAEVNAMIQKIPLSREAYTQRCAVNSREVGNAKVITRHKPHGVLAVLGPFNFPGHLSNGHIVSALLAGNTIVFKPSEHTPLTAEITKECWSSAGLPEGVLHVVQGARETGQWLVGHPGIDGLLFTGSWPAGKHFCERWATHPNKILALEMGGNNPLVVTHVKDKAAAAYAIVQSSYVTSGQRCSCARRLILLKDQAESVLAALNALMKHITVGAYTERPEPFMGSVISHTAAQRILDAQSTLQSKGGKSLVEMKLLKPNTGLLSPGLIDVTDVKERVDEEIFGPLLQVIQVDDFAAAIQEANNTTYGLTAGLLSDDRKEYEEFYKQVRAGIINWNTPLTGASSAAPFGGIGHSGNHRPSAFYAADYCSYPVASMEADVVTIPSQIAPGLFR